jgi:hypothetical protein
MVQHIRKNRIFDCACAGIVVLLSGLNLFIGCTGDSGAGPENVSGIAIDYPKGGELFQIGTSVTITFRANGDSVQKADIYIKTGMQSDYRKLSKSTISMSVSGTGAYEYAWIVGSEASVIDYIDTLGEMVFPGCRIRIMDAEDSSAYTISDEFSVEFRKKYHLRLPIGGEEYFIDDSIPVVYTQNTDSSSSILTFFWSNKDNDWVEFIGISIPEREVKTRKRYFLPRIFDDEGHMLGDSITKILINDYSIKIPQESGWIRIKRNK